MYKKPKVILITNIPNPYRIPLFNALSKQLEEKGMHLKVLFGGLGYKRRKWEVNLDECLFDYVVLQGKGYRFTSNESATFAYSGLFKEVRKNKPIAIITNGFSPATMKLWFRNWFSPVPVIIWSGDITNKILRVSFLRKMQRKLLVKRAKGFVAYGSRAKEYLVSLGAKSKDVAIGINTVDTRFYAGAFQKWKEKWSTDQIFNLLYVGNLTKNKRVDLLLEVASKLKERDASFVLRIVGDGIERETIENSIKRLDISNVVKLEGFHQKDAIKNFLVNAHCFLFPSEYDVWGLVLVEAMAAGVPCIASTESGATSDLVKAGDTGFPVNFRDTTSVADNIESLINNRALAEYLGKNAANLIANSISIQKSAESFVAAYLKAIDNT